MQSPYTKITTHNTNSPLDDGALLRPLLPAPLLRFLPLDVPELLQSHSGG